MTTTPATGSSTTSTSLSTPSSGKQKTLRCGVVGVGRMGRHHARVYAQLDHAELVGVVDQNVERRSGIAEEWGGRGYETIDELLDAGVDAVTIATPTITHRDLAERCIAAGVACLIEKPLAPDVEESTAIVEAAKRSGTIIQVGHILRYDPVMRAIMAHGDVQPRFIEVDRISPMTFRSVDVGVVLDMMIHDLDLLLMFIGREPQRVDANAVCVLGEAEDVCNARLVFPPGDDSGAHCVANVTASRLALKTERKIRIIAEDFYISADFIKRTATIIRKTANEAQLAAVREELKKGRDLSDVNYLDLVKIDDLKVGDEEPLRLQVEDFLSCVREGRQPTVDAAAGLAAVRTAQRIVEAAKASGSKMV